jgi:intron-binding protein aquarius
VGYLRDIRRLTVALSRARLGMYILGRREVFEACYELRQAFELLLQRPDKLALVTGEMWPSERVLADEVAGKPVEGEATMEGVEHLGQFVFEMTNTKIKQMRTERGVPDDEPVPEAAPAELPGGEGEVLGTIDEEDAEEAAVDGFEAEED